MMKLVDDTSSEDGIDATCDALACAAPRTAGRGDHACTARAIASDVRADLMPIAPARAPPDDPVSELEFGA